MWAPSEHRKSSADAYIGAVTSGGVASSRDSSGGTRWRPSDMLNEAVDPLSLPHPSKLKSVASVPSLGMQRQMKQVAWAIEEDAQEEVVEVETSVTGNSLVKASSAPSSTLEAAMEDARNSEEIGPLLLQPPAAPTQPALAAEDLALPGGKKPEPIRTKAVAELTSAGPPPPSPKRKLRETPIERRLSLGGKDSS